MRSNESEELLNVRQAGDLLQPYLPRVNAYALLKKDRARSNPLLDFTVVDGKAYYRATDVKHFLRTILLGMQQNHVYEQITNVPLLTPNLSLFRHAIDRRRLVQRRSNIVTQLDEKFERRFDDNATRRTGQSDRRQNSNTR